MTRRRLLFGLLLASVVLACFAGWLVMSSGPRVTRARLEQVKEGMTREEVIRTVGAPPGDYTNGPVIMQGVSFTDTSDIDAFWVCDDAGLIVYFDDAGTVSYVSIVDVIAPSPTLTEKIRRWLGL